MALLERREARREPSDHRRLSEGIDCIVGTSKKRSLAATLIAASRTLTGEVLCGAGIGAAALAALALAISLALVMSAKARANWCIR